MHLYSSICLLTKGYFTIINIFTSVQRVHFFMTPPLKVYKKNVDFFL